MTSIQESSSSPFNTNSSKDLITDCIFEHSKQFQELQRKLQEKDEIIQKCRASLQKLHKERNKNASIIMKILNHTKTQKDEKKVIIPTQQQTQRMSRLETCSKLLGNKTTALTSTKKPLPELPPLRDNNLLDSSSINSSFSQNNANFCVSQPNLMLNFNETGILYHLAMCPEDHLETSIPPFQQLDLKFYAQTLPSVLATNFPTSREFILTSLFKTFANINDILYDEFPLLFEPKDIHQIEDYAANFILCRKVMILLPTQDKFQYAYLQGEVKHTITIKKEFIKIILKGTTKIISEPNNSTILDVSCENDIFDGSHEAMIFSLPFPRLRENYIIIGLDKFRDSDFKNQDSIKFTEQDRVKLKYFISYVLNQISLAAQTYTSVSEKELSNLISKISDIAQQPNSHNMLNKIVETSNELTNASTTRIFSISGKYLYEETPGSKGHSEISLDECLIGKTVEEESTIITVLPRKEPVFSVIDDITEPRVWTMLTTPAIFNNNISLVLSLYNRKNNTFFDVKDKELIEMLSRCICPFLYETCQFTILYERQKRMQLNLTRLYNFTVYLLKSIQAAGTSQIYSVMSTFWEKLTPAINFRLLIFDTQKIVDFPSGNTIPSEPQLLDAICSCKSGDDNPPPTTCIIDDKAIIIFPIPFFKNKIKLPPTKNLPLPLPLFSQQAPNRHPDDPVQVQLKNVEKIFLLEFSTKLLDPKTPEEENIILQRSRLLRSFKNYRIQHYMDSNEISELPIPPYLSLLHINPNSSLNTPSSSEREKSIFSFSSALNSTRHELMSISSPNFEETVNEVPFDNFLTAVLKSFSIMTTRHLRLHLKIISLNRYKVTARALHRLGNALAFPLSFSECLKIMMVSFTNLYKTKVRIKIYDPPLTDAKDTDPTAFNIERNRMIFASIYIPGALSIEKSTALASFADLLSNLIESRQPPAIPTFPQNEIQVEDFGWDLIVANLTTSEMCQLNLNLFKELGILEVLNISEEKALKWISLLSAKGGESGLFFSLTDSFHFAVVLLRETGWINVFNKSELSSIGLLALLGSCFPQMHADFKYEKFLINATHEKISQIALTKTATILVLLADLECDLLQDTKENYLEGLIELLESQSPISTIQLLARFSAIAKKLDLNIKYHRILAQQFIIQMAHQSVYFRPMSTFGRWEISFAKEPMFSLMLKLKTVIPRYANAIKLLGPQFDCIEKYIPEKIEWVTKERDKIEQFQRNEEEEKLSLFEAY